MSHKYTTDDWKYNNFTESVFYTCTWRYYYEEYIGSIVKRCYNEGVNSTMDDANIQAGFSVQRVYDKDKCMIMITFVKLVGRSLTLE